MRKILPSDLVNKGVIGLPDTPGLDTTQMQQKFDEIALDVIIPHYNDLVDGVTEALENAGDMQKSVYDTDDNGRVDSADAVSGSYMKEQNVESRIAPTDDKFEYIIPAGTGVYRFALAFATVSFPVAYRTGDGTEWGAWQFVTGAENRFKNVRISANSSLQTQVRISYGNVTGTPYMNVSVSTESNSDIEFGRDNFGRAGYRIKGNESYFAFGNDIGSFKVIKVGDTNLIADNEDTVTLIAGDNVTLTPNAVNKTVTIDVTGGSGSGDMEASTYDPDGDVATAGGIPDYVADQIPDVSGKADKVSNATNGNFAGLDANGNLTDSGSKASDFLVNGTPDDVSFVGAVTVGTRGSGIPGAGSLANGYSNIASGESSHAEGSSTTCNGMNSHTEGVNTYVPQRSPGYQVLFVSGAHAEGYETKAQYSYQHVEGKYNDNKSDTLLEVGNGTADNARSNAFEVYSDGKFSQDDGASKFRFTQNNGVDGYYDANNVFHAIGGGTQVQSDWNQSDSTAVDFIKNKPTIPSGDMQASTYDPNGNVALAGGIEAYINATVTAALTASY